MVQRAPASLYIGIVSCFHPFHKIIDILAESILPREHNTATFACLLDREQGWNSNAAATTYSRFIQPAFKTCRTLVSLTSIIFLCVVGVVVVSKIPSYCSCNASSGLSLQGDHSEIYASNVGNIPAAAKSLWHPSPTRASPARGILVFLQS
jgi:hypothetical protein